ncbi:hypothetical protein [Anaeromyxobacter oryzae]|uniref:Uncharacterized protein n=1 Tax=Anaeromyxobacter oryzae TaxID=2918170 RepID=A0ABN6MTN6_9BACT|nr:hypothetical protein [Anaeromyxobacter oryzae]BDG02803.1 hypothetical protein AMOR_17990 [Anaeromyxobacter oryzae]
MKALARITLATIAVAPPSIAVERADQPRAFAAAVRDAFTAAPPVTAPRAGRCARGDEVAAAARPAVGNGT